MYKSAKIILFVSKTKRNHGLEWWVYVAYHFVYPDLGRLSRGLTVTGTKLTLAELINMLFPSGRCTTPNMHVKRMVFNFN